MILTKSLTVFSVETGHSMFSMKDPSPLSSKKKKGSSMTPFFQKDCERTILSSSCVETNNDRLVVNLTGFLPLSRSVKTGCDIFRFISLSNWSGDLTRSGFYVT